MLTLSASAGAIALADQRRRTFGRVLLVVAAVMVVMTVGIAVGRAYYLDRVGSSFPRAAAAVPFDGLVRSLRMWVRILFVAATAGWFATWFAGSRELMAREHEIRASLSVGVRAHGRVLAGAGVVAAALALVAWDRPSPRAVFGVLMLLVLWEAALRVLARETATS